MGIIENENTHLIEENHKSMGYLYYPRKFIYLRTVIIEEKSIIILTKNINPENKFNDTDYINGEINFSTLLLAENPDRRNYYSMLIFDIEIDNKGYLTKNQNRQLSLQYLLGFKNLEQYLKQTLYLQSFNNTDFNYKTKGIQRIIKEKISEKNFFSLDDN